MRVWVLLAGLAAPDAWAQGADPCTPAEEVAYWPDLDDDGFGDADADAVVSCDSPPAGFVANNGDCDDGDGAINPDADEVCDGVDNDCAGGADDGLTFVSYWPDLDDDGFGDGDAEAVSTCDGPPAGFVDNDGDCDDGDGAINPDADEVCDGVDNDCVGGADDGLTFVSYWPDLDGDGFGDVDGAAASTCDPPPAGTADNDEDCDDGDLAINPDAEEIVADGIDQDCDGLDACYVDDDDDTFGAGAPVPGPLGCGDAGFAALDGDCDDGDDERFPGNPEVCDGKDNDCSGEADSGLVFVDYYVDGDGDGFGALGSTPQSTCDGAPDGFVTDATDCDDAVATTFPGATEVVANGVDEDCDGSDTCWRDADGDGFGRPEQVVGVDLTCGGEGESTVATDCDDDDPSAFPGQSWFADCDGDGAPASDEHVACLATEADLLTGCGAPLGGYVNALPADPDCDDSDPVQVPGQLWHPDCDGDGAFAADGVVTCARADADAAVGCAGGDAVAWSNTAPAEPDCDDEDALRSPDFDEVCEPLGQLQVDNDCDGDVNGLGPDGGPPTASRVFYADVDRDGFGDPGVVIAACEAAPGIVPNAADCDDGDPSIFVGADEICDGRDQNCNGLIDEPDFLAAEGSFCVELYRDRDGDGYGDQGATQCLCADIGDGDLTVVYDNENYVPTYSDCDDLHAELRPHGCNDGADNDGDGLVDAADPDCAPVVVDGVTRRPTVEGTGPVAYHVELLDGHDNDCDGFIPYIELDCDDDGSFAALPIPVDGPIANAAEVGLAPCSGPPIQAPCWDETLTLECDPDTGLWVTRWGASDDGFGGRFTRAYRNLTSTACDRTGDCDDHCPDRCPGVEERCDGVDNDCSGLPPEPPGATALPRSMRGAAPVGTVSSAEIDRDGDGFVACLDDFRSTNTQDAPGASACAASVIEDRASDCNPGCYLSNALAPERCNGFVDTCGGELAAEGADADRDGYRACGVDAGVGEPEEQRFLPVWLACTDAQPGCDAVGPAPAGAPALVPLLLPRPLAPACDAPLAEALGALLAHVGGPPIDQLTEARELVPLLCGPGSGGVCTTVELTDDGAADSPEWIELAGLAGTLPLDCDLHPEQHLSRAVWSADRILQARFAVVEAECLRLHGVPCAQVGPGTPMIGAVAPPDPGDLLDAPERWWQEIGRYRPQVAAGALMTCWGDPALGPARLGATVGGDCDDARADVHRDQPEGPGDLLGIYLGDPGSCARCTDGLDNNCDGRIDCEDPSCAVCFVGEGRGCSGTRDPCNPSEGGAGCQTSGAGATGGALALVFAGLMRRRRRAG